MSDPDDDDDGETHRQLARIAHVLGVPMQAFFGPPDGEASFSPEAEERELIDLFRALRDPKKRRSCLDLVRRLVKGSDGD